MKIEDIFQNGHMAGLFHYSEGATVEHIRDDQHQQHQSLKEL